MVFTGFWCGFAGSWRFPAVFTGSWYVFTGSWRFSMVLMVPGMVPLVLGSCQ